MHCFEALKPVMLKMIGIALLACAAGNAAPKPKAAKAAKAPEPAFASKAVLDTPAVRKLYLDGDFDPAIDHLESSLRFGAGHSHRDSVFIFKHLGVMYAAKYETREKGKLYMHKLLETEPTARIMDMYASDMIYMIFKNIQDEFNSSRPIDPVRPEPKPRPEPVAEGPRKEKGYAWVGWTAGALAAAGGIALGIHMLQEEKPAPSKDNVTNE